MKKKMVSNTEHTQLRHALGHFFIQVTSLPDEGSVFTDVIGFRDTTTVV